MNRLAVALVLLLGLAAPHAAGNTQQAFKGRVLTTALAGADKTGDTIDASNAISASFQCVWASLTGSVDGTVAAQVSNDGGTSWDSKSGASITLSGASGHETVSLNGVAVENKYRLLYTHNSVSGGTVNCYAALKG